MQLQKLEREHLPKLIKYFKNQDRHMSNYSAGMLYIWSKQLDTHFAEVDDCLVLCDRYFGSRYFYWPLSESGDTEAEKQVVNKIERFCRSNCIRLHFTAIPKERLYDLMLMYGADAHVSNIRRWRDYLYNADDFKEYPGKRYSGQRNHVNKFKKNNPDFAFEVYTEEQRSEVEAFLHEVEGVQLQKGTVMANEEIHGVFDILPDLDSLNMFGGVLRAGGKVVAFSAGEICGDTLIVHIEKALREVAGAYPAMAQMFAVHFCTDKVRYINREDDAGDMGLRKSKLQYLPVQLVDKYNIAVHRSIDSLSAYPIINTARLQLKEIQDSDVQQFARLARDEQLNRYWGYDWKQNAPDGSPADSWFLQDVRNDFKQKNELPLGIYYNGLLVGEVVLHNFGYRAEAEIGMRVLPEYQGKGIAKEALKYMMDYGFSKLNLEKIEAKCFKANTISAYTLRSVGMQPCGENDTYYYFCKTAAM